MQELNLVEIDAVNGALGLDDGINIIGGIAGVCSMIPGLQGAAAFGAGVYFGAQIVKAWANGPR